MKHVVKNTHFVGIGGASMSDITEVLLNLGYRVTGLDLGSSATMQRLVTPGAAIIQGHTSEHVTGVNAAVVSTAVHSDNLEALAARAKRISIVPRAVVLAELMRLKQSIIIVGTRGRTTTTSLVASVLTKGDLDPAFVVGGHLNPAGTNTHLGTDDFIVAETDESDTSFLNLLLVIEVIANVDTDHMGTYGHDFTRLKQAFIELTQRLPSYGIAVLRVNDSNMCEILSFVSKPIVCYGFVEDAQVRAVNARVVDDRMEFIVIRQLNSHIEPPLSIMPNLPGLYNAQNTSATIAITTELRVPDEAIAKTLTEFNGVGRRSQRYGEMPTADGRSRFTLIDNYGHHPVGMTAMLATARDALSGRRLMPSLQPHRFTRTRDCFEDLIEMPEAVDALLLAEVYATGEPPIVAADGRALTRTPCMTDKIEPVFVEQIEGMPRAIIDAAQDGDMVTTMGAGSTGQVSGRMVVLQAQARTANAVDLSGDAAA